jgi:hypothetical protein
MSSVITKNAQIGADPTATNNFTIYQPATPDGTLRIGNGNTGITSSLLTMTSAGNLGLGVTPSAWDSSVFKAFEIPAGSFNAYQTSQINLTQNAYYTTAPTYWAYKNTAAASLYRQTGGIHSWHNAPSGTSGTGVTFTQAMTLDASGNLLVGTTSASSNSVGHVLGWTAGNSSYHNIGHASGTASGSVYSNFLFNGTTIGSVSQNGTTGVLYNIVSDQRLKENIQDAASASALIDAIQVRQYDWKSDGSHQRYGFIAQELVSLAPEAVYQPANPDDMMAVDYSKLVPMLVKELQSLRARVAQLEAK